MRRIGCEELDFALGCWLSRACAGNICKMDSERAEFCDLGKENSMVVQRDHCEFGLSIVSGKEDVNVRTLEDTLLKSV